jgi:hypothetical protein
VAEQKPNIQGDELVARLEQRVEAERVQGAYADDLSDVEIEPPPGVAGFDLGRAESRVRFRPELGYSSKRVIGPGITFVKRFYLRLLFHVFDDLARQTDAALSRLESALAVEIATRERVEGEVRELEKRLDALEDGKK